MARTVIDKQSKNLESLKEFGTDYMKENIFKPRVILNEVHYNKNMLQIGKKMDGSIYTLDLSEACRCLILGATRCMPKGTIVQTKKGFSKIEDCKNVLSYNFEKGVVENKECIVHKSGLKKVVIIKTEVGDIKCSPEHKWFVKRNNKIIEVETKRLKKTDKLLRIND